MIDIYIMVWSIVVGVLVLSGIFKVEQVTRKTQLFPNELSGFLVIRRFRLNVNN